MSDVEIQENCDEDAAWQAKHDAQHAELKALLDAYRAQTRTLQADRERRLAVLRQEVEDLRGELSAFEEAVALLREFAGAHDDIDLWERVKAFLARHE